uniref:Uncharacterized protein n=1 Tax=Chromera velia CCMP2878 TaxID=1169474 RepID=A0A0G4IEC9_9ALVE|eukprot:Cvel_13570.t1-p1 / transcript=Cvel_13570.t1 / gene=Cvel_13570 / organism=Chromera_velia_CCMP2878 / gene_product=hypothetical protein / transcript_product=hypothetical protein / location=Cvel_scaffold932:31685-39909(+) / protein_length=959 / sequence_SO=supercontig / SO=protein_coding / is_pseudo=false
MTHRQSRNAEEKEEVLEKVHGLTEHQFSLNAGKLGLLLSSFPAGPEFLETLRGGPHVCKGTCLSVLNKFLQSLRVGVGGLGGAVSASLKTLNLSKCDLSDAAGATLLHSLPTSLEYLDLNDNRLRSQSMEALRSAFSDGTLSKLLGLDVSNNPLGPSGVATLASGLSASERALPLQSLKLSKTVAKAEGVKALSVPLKEGKAPSLQVLDLGGNDMRAEGVGGLAGAVGAGTLSCLRVLILKMNCLARRSSDGSWEFCGLSDLFSHQFPSLQELDLSENFLEGNRNGHSAVLMIGEALGEGRLPAVRTLNLLDTHMREADLTAVCTALLAGRAPHVKSLHFPRSYVASCQALASAVDAGNLAELRDVTFSNHFSEGLGVVTRSIVSGKTVSLRTLKIETRSSRDLELIRTQVDEVLGGLAEGLRKGGLRLLEKLVLDFEAGERVQSGQMSEFGRALGVGGMSRLRSLSPSWAEEGDEGVGALAEGLGSGGLVSLEELCLRLSCGHGEGNGCRELGEVLSSGKLSSLRKLLLKWNVEKCLERLVEGLEVGSLSEEVSVDLILSPDMEYADGSTAIKALAALIRSGKLRGLRKLRFDLPKFALRFLTVCDKVGDAPSVLGEALTHGGGEGGTAVLLQGFEELEIDCHGFKVGTGLDGLFRGIASGGDCLPSLYTISVSNLYPRDAAAASPLAECIRKGKFPRLRNLHFPLKFCPDHLSSFSARHRGTMQALAHGLRSPHAKSLRSLSLPLEEREGGVLYRAEAQVVQIRALAEAFKSGQLTGLEQLSFQGDLCTDSLLVLSDGLGSGKLRSLRSLHLKNVPLHGDGSKSALCQALSAEKMPELRHLMLDTVSSDGLKKLTETWVCSTPPPLETLDLSRSAVGDEGIMALVSVAKMGRLPFLKDVRVRYGKGGCRCFGGPLGSLGIASPPCSTGVNGDLGGASRLYASICVEPDGVPPDVSLR